MLGLQVKKRQSSPLWISWLVLFSALILSFFLSGLLLAVQGKPAVGGIILLVQGAFGASWALEDCLLKAIPIFLCSLGVAITFRLHIWNIGAEGQFALGALASTWIALNFGSWPWFILIPLMLLAASLGGALWALIPALLKTRLNVNEIIVTLMFNYIGVLLLDHLVYGSWKDPTSFGMPMTPEFSSAAIIAPIGTSRVHWGLAFCILAAAGIWALFKYTRTGYEIRSAGENMRSAAYAGINYPYLVLLVMGVGGALAGWAGFIESSATLNRLQPSIMAGYGYTAIVVAWLAKLSPLKIGIASFLLAGLRVGVENLQLELQVPAAFGGIIEGLVLLSVLGGEFFNQYCITRRK